MMIVAVEILDYWRLQESFLSHYYSENNFALYLEDGGITSFFSARSTTSA